MKAAQESIDAITALDNSGTEFSSEVEFLPDETMTTNLVRVSCTGPGEEIWGLEEF
jgi:hypothetical protein